MTLSKSKIFVIISLIFCFFPIGVFSGEAPYEGPFYKLDIQVINKPQGLDISLEKESASYLLTNGEPKIKNETDEVAKFYIDGVEIFQVTKKGAFRRSPETGLKKINPDNGTVIEEASFENPDSASDLFFDYKGNIYLITYGGKNILRIKSFKDKPEVIIKGGELKYTSQQPRLSANQHGCFGSASFAKENEIVVADGFCNSVPKEYAFKVINIDSQESTIIKGDLDTHLPKIVAGSNGNIYILNGQINYLERQSNIWKVIDPTLEKYKKTGGVWYVHSTDIAIDRAENLYVLYTSLDKAGDESNGVIKIIQKDGKEFELGAFKEIAEKFSLSKLATEDGDTIYILGREKGWSQHPVGYKIFKYTRSINKLETFGIKDLFAAEDIRVFNKILYLLDLGYKFEPTTPILSISPGGQTISSGKEFTIDGKLGSKDFTVVGSYKIVSDQAATPTPALTPTPVITYNAEPPIDEWSDLRIEIFRFKKHYIDKISYIIIPLLIIFLLRHFILISKISKIKENNNLVYPLNKKKKTNKILLVISFLILSFWLITEVSLGVLFYLDF